MKIEDFWIGDLLILKKSGRIGKFAGSTPDKKLKIMVEGKVVLTKIGNVDYAPDLPSSKEEETVRQPLTKKFKPRSLESVIDLHMEVLRPSMQNARPERILNIQLEAAKDFIEDAIHARTRKVEIIHGKGEGVLKSEVRHLLSLYDEIEQVFEKNQGGSCEVWFV